MEEDIRRNLVVEVDINDSKVRDGGKTCLLGREGDGLPKEPGHGNDRTKLRVVCLTRQKRLAVDAETRTPSRSRTALYF